MFKKAFIPLLVIFISSCEMVGMPEVEEGTPVHSASEMFFLHEKKNKDELKEFLGVDPSRTEWCAAFMNAILSKHNIPGSESVSEYPLLAKSFLYWGETVNEPEVGDVVIFSRGNEGWQGHVAFYISESKDGKYYYVLGGNQSDMINIEKYSKRKLLGIRRYNPS